MTAKLEQIRDQNNNYANNNTSGVDAGSNGDGGSDMDFIDYGGNRQREDTEMIMKGGAAKAIRGNR